MSEKWMFILIFSGTWAVVGTIFLIIGKVMLYIRKKKEMNCTLKTYGKVKDMVRHRDYGPNSGYSSSWHPVFEYNIGELKFIKESAYGSFQSKFAIGQEVEIYYNPEDYNDFYVAGDNLPKTLGKIFTAVGIGTIMIGVVPVIFVL